jgi:hypothetical protein
MFSCFSYPDTLKKTKTSRSYAVAPTGVDISGVYYDALREQILPGVARTKVEALQASSKTAEDAAAKATEIENEIKTVQSKDLQEQILTYENNQKPTAISSQIKQKIYDGTCYPQGTEHCGLKSLFSRICFDNPSVNNISIILNEGMLTDEPTTCKQIKKFMLKQVKQDNGTVQFEVMVPKIYLINANYFSRGLLKDAATLSKDAGALEKLGCIPHTLYSHERVLILKELIKYELLHRHVQKGPNGENILPKDYKVYVCGMSHGSLLVHGAIVKLQMDMDIRFEHLQHLYVLTNGSPRYLPTGLIPRPDNYDPRDPPLLNFYHVKDPYIRLLRKKMLKKRGFLVPDLEIMGFTEKDCSKIRTHPYKYVSTKSLVMIEKCSFMAENDKKYTDEHLWKLYESKKFVDENGTEVDNESNPHELFIKHTEGTSKGCNDIIPYKAFRKSDVGKSILGFLQEAGLYHVSLNTFYPLLFNTTITWLNDYTRETKKDKFIEHEIFHAPTSVAQNTGAVSAPVIAASVAPALQGGAAASPQRITYNKKRYIVRVDKQGRSYILVQKERVYVDQKKSYKKPVISSKN